MATHLPIPVAYYPRTEQDLATVGERLGGRVSLRVGERVEKTVITDGAPEKKKIPSFIEWWLEYPAEFVPLPWPEPPPPDDPRVAIFLTAVARVAAQAWAKESKVAKGWPPDPPSLSHGSTAAQAPFALPTARKGSK